MLDTPRRRNDVLLRTTISIEPAGHDSVENLHETQVSLCEDIDYAVGP